jgi:transcriptional regulator with XRE-family HTH domain
MKRPKDRFDRNKELGKRLRECRVKVGLTQQMLATAMGRQGKGSHHVAGRLERGEVPHPSLGLIADYLRACRAGFADVLSVLDPYTSQPTVVEIETEKAVAKVSEHLPPKVSRAVERYDRRVVKRAEIKYEPLPAPAERVRRARSFGLSQVWAGRVRREVVRIIETRQLGAGTLYEHFLQDYAAKVWRILNGTRGRREVKRPALLKEAAVLFLVEGGPSTEDLQAVKEGVLSFFRETEIAGGLDTALQLASGETQLK